MTAPLLGKRPVTVVVACYDGDRWLTVCRAIESVLAQNHPVVPVVVVDYNEELYARLTAWCAPIVTVVRNSRRRGASGARNTGAYAATTDLVAFLDDDATATPSWLSELVEAVRSPRIVGVGGAISPVWPASVPWWFPDEFGWVVGATEKVPNRKYRRVRNVWSGNMLVRRDIFIQADGFREDFGKVGDSREPEDTELCIRMSAMSNGGEWRSIGAALVHHLVPAERATPSFFVRRCWAEGSGKAALARAIDIPSIALSAERHYLCAVLPRAVAARARAIMTGELTALGQTAMIVTGAAVASMGFALARLGHYRIGSTAGPAAEARSAPAGEPRSPGAVGSRPTPVGHTGTRC